MDTWISRIFGYLDSWIFQLFYYLDNGQPKQLGYPSIRISKYPDITSLPRPEEEDPSKFVLLMPQSIRFNLVYRGALYLIFKINFFAHTVAKILIIPLQNCSRCTVYKTNSYLSFTLGGIASICFRFYFQQTLRLQIQVCQGCQKTRNFMKNSKILIARSTIQPKLSKIKNNLPFFKEF